MPRYVIERNFGLIDDDEMQELADAWIRRFPRRPSVTGH
jgi:hypothetical protein